MKTFLLLLILCFFSITSFSQRQLPCFIGMGEKAVFNYLDSLNKLSSNPYYKIKTQTNNYGDLVYTCEYALNEEYLYKCLTVMVVFVDAKAGKICYRQVLIGSEEYTQDNLKFIKENFTNKSKGEWEMPYENGLKLFATFERKDGQYPKFIITYELGK